MIVNQDLQNSDYPVGPGARDGWILDRRPPRITLDPFLPHGWLLERECADSRDVVDVATVFLTNRECPWRCLMCDLWKTTVPETVPPGAILAQIDHAFTQLGVHPRGPSRPQQLKLYNSGSFFDPRAIPSSEHNGIAQLARDFDRLIVECHPSLVGDAVVRFRDLLVREGSAAPGPSHPKKLEVAMGLETVHPDVLDKLNKRMTVDHFRRAAEFLNRHGIALRAFVLVKPPFLDESSALDWAQRSMDFAFDCQATVVSLIPTRAGNGALEALQVLGHFSPPRLSTLEAALAYGLGLGRGRTFADLWDLERFSDCPHCFQKREQRLLRMNRTQRVEPAIPCPVCAGGQRKVVT